MKNLKVDWNNLIDAFSSEHEDYLCFLSTVTGDVSWRSIEVVEREKSEGKNSKNSEFVEVPHITPREGWELMMDFVDKVFNKQLKPKLQATIQGKGAFRRFKEILTNFPSDQERWYVYQDAAHTKLLDQWLMTIDIESNNTPTYDITVGDRVALEKPPIDNSVLDTILLAADNLVGIEGKTFLAQVLKGSKAKAIKEKNGDQIPGYGALSKMTIKEVEATLDKVIQTKWLDIETSPVEGSAEPKLTHSRKGWDRVKELWTERLFNLVDNAQDPEAIQEFIACIKLRHRDIRQHFLDLLFKKGEKKHVPVVEAWKNDEVRKFKKRLIGLLRKISGEGRPPFRGNRHPRDNSNRGDQHRPDSRPRRPDAARQQSSRDQSPRQQSPRDQTSRDQT